MAQRRDRVTNKGARGPAVRTPWRKRVPALLVTVALTSSLLAPLPGTAFTLTTIIIDGQFNDWIGVRSNPANVVADSQIPDDPDYPGQPDRDVYLVGTTYDDDYLYFSWRRTAGGVKAITFGAYLDYEGDGLLQDTDKVVLWTVSTGQPYATYANGNASILHYNQARNANGSFYHPDGDPMRDVHRTGVPTGDGETPDGWAVRQDGYDVPLMTLDGRLSAAGDGIECEARVAWSDLGVEPGHPFAIHFAAGNGSSWGTRNKPSVTYKWTAGEYIEENRGQVEDNIEPIMYLLHLGVTVSPDNVGGGAAGSTITYVHTIANEGNTTETFDLTALSSRGWTVSVTDANGDPLTAVTLAAGETRDIQVTVTIPGGATDGQQDVTTLTATARGDPRIADTATDTTLVGQVTVTPNQSATMAPGYMVEYEFLVQNNMPGAGVFDLTTVSSLGWMNYVRDLDGNTITSVSLSAGESATVRVQVYVPATATIGQQDVTRLTATRQSSTTLVRSSATASTTVLDGLTIRPNNESYAGAGTIAQYTHTITNSWPTTRTVELSYTSSEGWPVTFYAADGLTPITAVSVGPNGAMVDIIARVAVPSSASPQAVDATLVYATAPTATGIVTVSATDTTTVRQLTTYADGGYVNQTDAFILGQKIFGRATGLAPGSYVYFVWKDDLGTIVRTSSNRKVDTQGMAFDEYTTLESDLVGNWRLEIYSDRGVFLEDSLFTVTFDAEITALSATDAPGVGQDVAVTSSAFNSSATTITASAMAYVIWWDSDGNGAFGAGDVYIDDTGAPVVWDGDSPVTATHVTSGITVAGGNAWTESTPWTVSNTQFPNQGTYRVTATWTDSDGNVIDVATTEFYSIPTLGWPLFVLTIIGAALVLWGRRRGVGGEAA